jgi:vacuolar-type H+-ATPase subunit F/Vma7
MSKAIFIGDELSSAGFRLTGIEMMMPAPEDVGAALRDARQRAGLVIMIAELAKRVPAAELEAAMLAEAPTLAILPDVLFQSEPPDLGKKLRSVLGIES